MWGESSSTESSIPPSGGRLEYVYQFPQAIEDCLTYDIPKVMHTLLTDAEAVFLGFSNACVSAGNDGCKLVTLLHEDATGQEVKRLIEDSHDVGNRFDFRVLLPYPSHDS